MRNPGQPEAWLPRRWVCIQTHHARRGMGPAGAGTVLPCGPGGLTGSGCCSPQGSEVDACPPHRRSATASKGVLQALLAPRREACVCTPFPHPVGPQRGGRARRAAGGHGTRVTVSPGCTPSAAALGVFYQPGGAHSTPRLPRPSSLRELVHLQPAHATVHLPGCPRLMELLRGCGSDSACVGGVALPGRVAELVCRDGKPYLIPQQCTPS